MVNSELKAYAVEVRETFKKRVIVYAESESAAAETADELSSRGELGSEHWTPDSREASCTGQATVEDFGRCEKYEF